MFIVGLTGGIASGKSTITCLFCRHGISHVDADQVARDIVMPGERVLEQLVARYGKQLLQTDGQLERRALRQIIFNDKSERHWVEALMHPAIRNKMFEQIARFQSPYALLVAPLLFETGLDQQVDRTLVIDIPQELQRSRLKNRDHCSEAQINAILQAQLSREARLSRADDVIDNSGEPENKQLVRRIAELDHYYRQLASAKPS